MLIRRANEKSGSVTDVIHDMQLRYHPKIIDLPLVPYKA